MSIIEKIKDYFAKQKKIMDTRSQSIKNFLQEEFAKKPDAKIPVDEKELDFVKDTKSAMLSEQTPYINSVLYIIAALLVLGLIWAKFAVVEQVTKGEGKVIPSTHVKSIQSLDGGILAKLFVKEGQVVQVGQLLAQLSITDFEADYLASKKHYLGLLATMARLQAEAANDNSITFPPELAKETELKDSEIKFFNSRKQALNERLQNLQQSYELMDKQLNIMKPLVAQGVSSKMEYLQLQNNLNSIKGNIQNEKNKFHQDVLTELDKNEDEIKTLREKIIGLEDRIARTTFRSPVFGVVKQIYATTIGGVIKPGGDIMQIVPLEDTLLVEAKVSPSDIAFIHPGQKATVTFSAYDYSIYGSLEGNVNYISADTVVDERGDTYYLVQVQTNHSYLGTAQKPLPIIPGMVATVNIMTGKKSILDYILKPIIKSKYEALRER